jgi:hypothetical protein
LYNMLMRFNNKFKFILSKMENKVKSVKLFNDKK